MTSVLLRTVRKGNTIVILCLLMLGYLAVNLWSLPALGVSVLRVSAMVAIFLLLALSLSSKSISSSIAIIGLVAMIAAATSGIAMSILFLCVTVIALRKLPLEFIANSSAWVLAIALIVSVMLVSFGIVASEEDVTSSALELGGEIRSRMTFGYQNVNAFAGIVTGFCLLVMMTGRQAVIRYAVALIVGYVLYKYTDSRAMLLAILSFIAFTILFFLTRKSPRFLKAFAALTLITPVILTILASVIVSNAPLVDLVLSGRLNYVSMFFSEMPAYRFLIGGAAPAYGITVDNSFALVAGAIGIPLLIYLSYITFQRVSRCVNEGDFRIYSFLLAFWLYSFTESSMLRPESIVCIVFWVLVSRPRPVMTPGKY